MQYFLSLGSNLGCREKTICRAIECIRQQIGDVTRCSSFFYSEPWGFTSTHAFCNVCCLLETDKPPLEVLHLTQAIERSLGRKEKSSVSPNAQMVNAKMVNYKDRSIDIDLIRVLDGDRELICSDAELTLPHPLWSQREFVTIPLKEIMV